MVKLSKNQVEIDYSVRDLEIQLANTLANLSSKPQSEYFDPTPFDLKPCKAFFVDAQ
jgi:hypothetical protein